MDAEPILLDKEGTKKVLGDISVRQIDYLGTGNIETGSNWSSGFLQVPGLAGFRPVGSPELPRKVGRAEGGK